MDANARPVERCNWTIGMRGEREIQRVKRRRKEGWRASAGPLGAIIAAGAIAPAHMQGGEESPRQEG